MCTDTTKKFDPTKPVQTRDGRKARIVDTNYKGGPKSILAIVTLNSTLEAAHAYNKDGSYLTNMTQDLDLINIPEKYTLWVNLYADRGSMFTHSHSSRAQADVNAGASRIACVKVEFEEGEGL